MTGKGGKIGVRIGVNEPSVMGTTQSGVPAPTAPQYNQDTPTAPQYNQDTPTTLGRGISKELSHTIKHVPYSSACVTIFPPQHIYTYHAYTYHFNVTKAKCYSIHTTEKPR